MKDTSFRSPGCLPFSPKLFEITASYEIDDIGRGSLNVNYVWKIFFLSCARVKSLGFIVYLECISDQRVVYALCENNIPVLDHFEVV